MSFFGHPEAVARSAVMYTLLGSCRRQGINPFDYLKDLFTRLPSSRITGIKQSRPQSGPGHVRRGPRKLRNVLDSKKWASGSSTHRLLINRPSTETVLVHKILVPIHPNTTAR